MLWLICQITVRQLVTPAPLMGRVNATVQTAIYGVRPLGALAGGFVAAQAGLHGALLLIAAAFALSTLVIVLSPLARLRVLPRARLRLAAIACPLDPKSVRPTLPAEVVA